MTAIEATTARTIGDPETFFAAAPIAGALELARQLAAGCTG